MKLEGLQLAPDQDPAQLADALVAEYRVARAGVRLVWAPYRVCPLGAHVDHQGGEVTGMALDRGLLLAFAPDGQGRVRMTSRDLPGRVDFDLANVPARKNGDWGNYPRGAAWALRQRHELGVGLVGMVQGGLPAGGVSTSAALGVACLMALEAVNGIDADAATNIELDRQVENTYLGLDNGILDQSMILLGRPRHLTHMDCRSRELQQVPLPDDAPQHDIMLVYSGVSASLIDTDYNRHVAECRKAASILLQRAGATAPDPPLLRDVPPEIFAAEGESLPEHLRRRVRHFATEQERVHTGLDAWKLGDLEGFGRLVSQSGASSIHNYGCGSPELVNLYEELCAAEGVYGARFSGAGFRGCCLALIDPSFRESIGARVRQRYLERFPERQEGFVFFSCKSGRGAYLL